MQLGSARRHASFVVLFAIGFAAGQQYTISTYAGGAPPPTPAPAVSGSIGYPQGVAADGAGNVYFTSLNCVFKVDASGTLTRIAGTSRAGYFGDGGPAASAQLYGPSGVAVDAAGNLFIADTTNNRVRKISSSGIITTVVGNGQQGYSGDGGPATEAQLNSPLGVAMDAAGNLFIADTANNRVRKVSTTAIITTVAGNGQQGYSGDGGSALSAQLSGPSGLAVDAAGNLFIADNSNNRVRKVSPASIITTVAGGGGGGLGDGGPAISAQLNDPRGVATDAQGNLFIADNNNQRVRKVSPASIITTVAGGAACCAGDVGPAASAYLNSAIGVAVDTAGNLFIADYYSRLYKVGSNSIITTIAGNGVYSYSGDGGPALSAQLSSPRGLAADATGNLFIADTNNGRLRKVSNGTLTTVAGIGSCCYSGDNGPATSAVLYTPYGVAVDAAGNPFIADTSNNRIRKVSADGTIVTVAGNGQQGYSGDGGAATGAQLFRPNAVAVDATGNLFIADTENNRVRKVSLDGKIATVAGNGQAGYSGDGGLATSASLNNPAGVAVDASGNVFIADYYNNRVRKVASNGMITTVAGGGTGDPGDGGSATGVSLNAAIGVAVDAAGNLFITDILRVLKVSSTGTITAITGNVPGYSGDGGPAASARLFNPSGVAVTAAGIVYVADSRNNAIRLLVPAASVPAPAMNQNGIVDGAGFKTSVAPGGIASVFGANLAAGTANSGSLPLPTTLAGASLTLGGKSAPLFYASALQLNVQVPWELAGLTQTSAVASVSSVAGNAQTVSVNAVSPGIFTANSSGSGQGVVTVSLTGQGVTPATPAPRGQYITIYCSGLGQVSNQPATGAPSPPSLSNTMLIPTVTIGGVQAPVQFSGLTPGLVGLYQVNALVPAAVSPGPAVSLVLSINGVSSNTVTIAVQ
jgi:trimeric autotransporter adhesin